MFRQFEGRTLGLTTRSVSTVVPKSGNSTRLLRRALLPTAHAYLPITNQHIHARGYATPPGKRKGGMGGPGGFNIFGKQHEKGEALKEYSVDLTELARDGKLDPTIGRDEEIRRTIQSA